MHNPTTVLENETHSILWDFDIQTDHLISARNNNQHKIKLAEFWTLLSLLTTKYFLSEKKDKSLDLARELKKT